MSPASPSHPCPCASGRPYVDCCQPFHQGQLASTPEALMRSRYTAYCLGKVDYLIKTTHREHPDYQRDRGAWRLSLARYCRQLTGLGLSVQATQPATDAIDANTLEGWVTFAARLQLTDEPPFTLTETSRFVRESASHPWLYHSGDIS